MGVPFLDSTSLLRAAKEEQLYDKLLLQLKKDFGSANIDIVYSILKPSLRH